MSYGQSPDLMPLFVIYICVISFVLYSLLVIICSSKSIQGENYDITKSYDYLYMIGFIFIFGCGILFLFIRSLIV